MPIKYIPYAPNTVEGQAVLDNITRTQRILRYRDNDKVYSKIQRGMPYYEVEPIEKVGDDSENLIIRGDCLSACAYLKEQNIEVDLVYIDPPFASGADYAKKVYIRKNPKLAEKIAQAEEELDLDELKAFEETMYGDIWKKEDYLNWVFENLTAIKSILSPTGCIYVHLDWHVGHYVKIILDEVFGEENFQNEIIWHYSGWNKKLKSSFEKRSDSIFLYTLNLEKSVFNSFFEPWESKEEYVKKRKQQLHKDEDGEEYVLSDAGNGKKVKRFISEALEVGKVVDNVWHMDKVNNSAKESTEYATQKPEALLNRIIDTSSNPGLRVADFFGGSGVTSKVANDLGRNFIHVDIGINSIQTARDRLVEAGASFQVLEIKDGVSLFRNPQQTMDKLAKLIPGLQQKVEGVNKFWFGALQDSKIGTVPVYVPNLLDATQKVLDIPAINRIINEEIQKLEITVQKAIVYYVDVEDMAALEKFIRDNNATTTALELRDLKTLLHEIVVEDQLTYSLAEEDGSFKVSIDTFFSDRLSQKINEFNEKGNLQALNKGKTFNPINISDEGLELIEHLSLDCENEEGEWHSSSEIKIDKLGYTIINGEKTKEFWDGTISSDKKPLRLRVRNISGDESVVKL